MNQPDELKKNEPLKWSPGRGSDVWKMFCACIEGDLATIKGLVRTREIGIRLAVGTQHGDVLRLIDKGFRIEK